MRQPNNPFWPQKSLLHPVPPREPYIPVRPRRISLTREEQRLVDEGVEERFAIPLMLLMEHAGLAVADTCGMVAAAKTTPIHIFAGKGNNGGDAYVCARIMHSRGYPVLLWDCFPGYAHTGLPKVMRDSARAIGVKMRPAEEFTPEALQGGISRMIDDKMAAMPCVIIDGVVGTGYEYSRPLPAYIRSITGRIEKARLRGARVVSIDIPTGIDANTGLADPAAVTADGTVTFILPKVGLLKSPGKEHAGHIQISSIGLPPNIADLVLDR